MTGVLFFFRRAQTISALVALRFSHTHLLVKEGPDASYIFTNSWNIMFSQPKLVGVTDKQKLRSWGTRSLLRRLVKRIQKYTHLFMCGREKLWGTL